jgi:hypothetical protein
MKYPIRKLYRGRASIRSHIVEKCIKNDESIDVIFEDKVMTLKPSELTDKKELLTPLAMNSKFKGQYQLYDYTFKPNQDGNQQQLF